jgi:(2R)-ethylmalonyl-CoA mutase
MKRLKEEGVKIPVVVGGIIPPEDAERLKQAGVSAVYTPKDFQITDIMEDVVRLVDPAKEAAA